MINQSERHPENAAGRWFVNLGCIYCDQCIATAPATFRASADGSQAVVYRQPATAEEERLARDARENCPVDSIEVDVEADIAGG